MGGVLDIFQMVVHLRSFRTLLFPIFVLSFRIDRTLNNLLNIIYKKKLIIKKYYIALN